MSCINITKKSGLLQRGSSSPCVRAGLSGRSPACHGSDINSPSSRNKNKKSWYSHSGMGILPLQHTLVGWITPSPKFLLPVQRKILKPFQKIQPVAPPFHTHNTKRRKKYNCGDTLGCSLSQLCISEWGAWIKVVPQTDRQRNGTNWTKGEEMRQEEKPSLRKGRKS